MQNWTYALLLIGSIAIPLIRSFEPRIRFYKKWPALFAGIAAMMFVFIPWDIAFTRQGIWSFNHEYVAGLYIAGLPLEEWLFFVVIPFCVVFTYEVIRLFLPNFRFPRAAMAISLVLGVVFLLLAWANIHRTYTLVVMLVAGILSLMQPFIGSHKTWLSHFFLTYLITLVPFFIINGVLTALPVVSYNDLENLGIRLHTIPVEDSVYLLGMMYVVNMVYESRGKKSFALSNSQTVKQSKKAKV